MFRERHFHLPRGFHSLRFRLLMMFLLIVLITVGIVSLFAEHSTAGSFRTYVNVKEQSSLKLALNQLITYNQQSNGNPNLQVEQVMIEQTALTYHVRVVVVTPAGPVGSVIADSDGSKLVGSPFSPKRGPEKNLGMGTTGTPVLACENFPPATIIISTRAAIYCAGGIVSLSKGGVTPEQTFLNAVEGSFLTGVLLAGLIALLLALAFSYTIIRPIKRMTGVARRMEEGDLSQRLQIKTPNEIGELAHALNTMADGLQRSELLRRNMINDIAHELRTPLTNIRGYLEALEDRVVDPTPEVIASLYEESSLLTRLVADLQELSLAEAGQLCLLRRPVAINECIFKAVQMLQLQATRKGVLLKVDLPPDLPLVGADPERVAQILRNLLGNALTHTPEGGEICVSAVKNGEEVLIRVRDSGCGIEVQHLPYIFERFYRADPSRTRTTGGSGLGLAIVKQMVHAHGGHVSVESQPGYGSCFAFALPALADSLALDYKLAGKS